MGKVYILITSVVITALWLLISSSRNLSEVLCQLLPLLFCLGSRTHSCLLSTVIISKDPTAYFQCVFLLPVLFSHPWLSQLVIFTSHCPLLDTPTTLEIIWSSSNPQTFSVNYILVMWLISFWSPNTEHKKEKSGALNIFSNYHNLSEVGKSESAIVL